MMNKELMIRAHKLTKEIKSEYPEVNYSFQLGLCIKFLIEEAKKEAEENTSMMEAMRAAEEEMAAMEVEQNTVIEKTPVIEYISKKEVVKQVGKASMDWIKKNGSITFDDVVVSEINSSLDNNNWHPDTDIYEIIEHVEKVFKKSPKIKTTIRQYEEYEVPTYSLIVENEIEEKEETQQITVEELIQKINNIEVQDGKVFANEWKKGDTHRIYVNHSWRVRGGREGRKSSYCYFTIENGVVTGIETDIRYNTFSYSAGTKRNIIAECEEFIA